jgi:hypothetical protein
LPRTGTRLSSFRRKSKRLWQHHWRSAQQPLLTSSSRQSHVRLWPSADISFVPINVRSWGMKRTSCGLVAMSGYDPMYGPAVLHKWILPAWRPEVNSRSSYTFNLIRAALFTLTLSFAGFFPSARDNSTWEQFQDSPARNRNRRPSYTTVYGPAHAGTGERSTDLSGHGFDRGSRQFNWLHRLIANLTTTF